jgi:Na+/phosphate symporter
LERTAFSVEGRVATFFLIAKLIPTGIGLMGGSLLRVWVAKLSPVTTEEALAKPIYLHDHALENPETAIELVKLETHRILERLPHYLDGVRDEPEAGASHSVAIEGVHHASLELGREINETVAELFALDMGLEESEALIRVHNQYHAVMELMETLYQLVPHIRTAGQETCLGTLCQSMSEGLHSMLQLAVEVADAQDREWLQMMTSDKGAVMEGLRNGYLNGDATLPQSSRATLLQVTTLFQRAVWQIHRWSTF